MLHFSEFFVSAAIHNSRSYLSLGALRPSISVLFLPPPLSPPQAMQLCAYRSIMLMSLYFALCLLFRQTNGGGGEVQGSTIPRIVEQRRSSSAAAAAACHDQRTIKANANSCVAVCCSRALLVL